MDRVLPDLSGKSYLGAKILSRSCLGQGGARKEEEEVREARAEDGLRPSGRPGGVWQRRVDSWGLGELTVKARHAQRAQLSLGWYSGKVEFNNSEGKDVLARKVRASSKK